MRHWLFLFRLYVSSQVLSTFVHTQESWSDVLSCSRAIKAFNWTNYDSGLISDGPVGAPIPCASEFGPSAASVINWVSVR
jgi:hypothetical protein